MIQIFSLVYSQIHCLYLILQRKRIRKLFILDHLFCVHQNVKDFEYYFGLDFDLSYIGKSDNLEELNIHTQSSLNTYKAGKINSPVLFFVLRGT